MGTSTLRVRGYPFQDLGVPGCLAQLHCTNLPHSCSSGIRNGTQNGQGAANRGGMGSGSRILGFGVLFWFGEGKVESPPGRVSSYIAFIALGRYVKLLSILCIHVHHP